MSAVGKIEEHVLPHPIHTTNCLTICPTMDLLSFQLDEKVVLIYRRGNEKVWDIEPALTASEIQQAVRLVQIEWKPDGNLFMTVTHTGELALYKTSTGNLLREFHLQTPLKYLKWYIASNRSNNRPQRKFEGLLKGTDIINSLPKLAFDKSTTNNIKSQDSFKDIQLDYIIALSESKNLCFIFEGIFVIEEIDVFHTGNLNLIEIVQQPNDSTLFCLTEVDNRVSLSKLHTPLSSDNLNLTRVLIVCSKIISLMNQFDSTLKQINNHYKPYIDYTVRIIELLRGEIDENSFGNNAPTAIEKRTQIYNENDDINRSSANADPVYDLYDLLLTGSLSNATKKWLTDYVSDRGIKRWTKLGRTYFDNAKSVTFNDLISSLHHLIVFLTDLNGLNVSVDTDNTYYAENVCECINTSESYLKYCYRFMMELSENQKYFEQTIAWLSSILDEITNDEKTSFSIQVNEITRYLMMLSERLDNSTKQTSESSKLDLLTDSLSMNLSNLFVKIKKDISSRFKVEKVVDLQTPINIKSSCKFEILNESAALLLTNASTSTVFISRIDLITSNQEHFEFKLSQDQKVVDALILSENLLLVLFSGSVQLQELNFFEISVSVQKTYVFSKGSTADESDFEAAHIKMNLDRTTFCVMDSNLKKYLWLSI